MRNLLKSQGIHQFVNRHSEHVARSTGNPLKPPICHTSGHVAAAGSRIQMSRNGLKYDGFLSPFLVRSLLLGLLLLTLLSCAAKPNHIKWFWGGDGDPKCLELEGQAAIHKCYVNALREQRTYANGFLCELCLDGTEIVSPAESWMQAHRDADFQRFHLWLTDIWELSSEERAEVYRKLKLKPWFGDIDAICIMNEPYSPRHFKTPKQLQAMVDEIRGNFPNVQIEVNFYAVRFLKYSDRIPVGIDIISVNDYPGGNAFRVSGDKCQDESAWKAVIHPHLKRIKEIADERGISVVYVAQGFTSHGGGRYCRLTADNVRWSYEVANELKLHGLTYYFPRGTNHWAEYREIGFREKLNETAEKELISIGKRIVRNAEGDDKCAKESQSF